MSKYNWPGKGRYEDRSIRSTPRRVVTDAGSQSTSWGTRSGSPEARELPDDERRRIADRERDRRAIEDAANEPEADERALGPQIRSSGRDRRDEEPIDRRYLAFPEAFANEANESDRRAMSFVVGHTEQDEKRELVHDYLRSVILAGKTGDATRFAKHKVNRALLQHRTLVEGTDSAGGYLVPTGYTGLLIKDPPPLTTIYPLSTRVGVNERSGTEPTAASLPTISYGSENTEITETGDPTFGETPYTLYRRQARIEISLEQIQDGNPNTMDTVMGLLNDALIAERDRMMAYGSGSGRPTGIYQSSGITDVSGITSISYANLTKMFFTVDPVYRDHPSCAWIANANVAAAIQLLTDSNSQPLLLSNLQTGWKPTLFGKPFITVPYTPNTFLGFGAHFLYRNYYHNKAPMVMDVSLEAGFDNYSAVIRLTERCDGKYVVPSTGRVPYARSKILTGVTSLVPIQ